MFSKITPLSLRAALLLLFARPAAAERINQEGRILGSLPVVNTPILFNTPEADGIVSAMQILPVNNPWNEDISRRPTLTNSSAMMTQIKADLPVSRQTLRPFYEMNYVLVPDNQPRVQLSFFNYPDESDLDGGAYPNGSYPVPANLPIETWPRGTGTLTLSQWQQDINNAGGDRHAIMVAPGAGFIWETWLTKLTSAGWEASNGAKFDLTSNALRPASWTSGDAAGLPMFPALVRYDECERGMVEHAVRLVVARTRREYIYPARHYASSIPATTINYPAMGQRLRLKSSYVIPDSWTTEEKAVLRSLKKYGAIVADNGGFFSISVCPDDRFSSNAFDHLSSVGIDNFEVIQTTGPAEGPRSSGAPAVNAGPDRFTDTATSISLSGAITAPGGNAQVQWRTYSGPASAIFSAPTQPVTNVTFPVPGAYTLILSADDGTHAAAYDAVNVRVTARAALANISTRLNVGTGNNVGVGGFIILGDKPKQVIVRALGPSLTSSGVSGVLNDPALQLFDSGGALIAANNDWRETQQSAIQQTTIAPTDDREAALVANLNPGAYTAVVSGQGASSGIGLVEVYDLETSATSKLANISTRGLVGAGAKVMIGGAIVTGSDPARVLFRVLGPSLTNSGISNFLADPQLDVFNQNGAKIGSNDNWQSDQKMAITATGLPPSLAAESALITDLPPGAYTAVVSGVLNGTGVALIEAYQLQ